MKIDKRKVFILILCILTIASIIGGTCFNVFRYKTYVKDAIIINEDELVDYENHNIIPSFDTLRIDGYVMEIEITSGDSYSYDVSYNHNSLEPIIKMEGDTLVIKQSKKPNLMGTPICKTIVTVPSNKTLSEIYIESNIGEVVLDNVKSDEVRVDTNIGQITLIDLDSDKVRAESNIGQVEVDVLGSIKDYNIDLETNLGETKVNGRSKKKSFSSYSDSSKDIRIETNIGEIKIYE